MYRNAGTGSMTARTKNAAHASADGAAEKKELIKPAAYVSQRGVSSGGGDHAFGSRLIMVVATGPGSIYERQ